LKLTRGFFSSDENAGKVFGKMGFLDSTMRTGYHLRIIGEKTESLIWMDNHMIAMVALKPFRTARNSCKYVIGIHRTQDQMATGPGFKAKLAYNTGRPSL